jgi:hypothetical protein
MEGLRRPRIRNVHRAKANPVRLAARTMPVVLAVLGLAAFGASWCPAPAGAQATAAGAQTGAASAPAATDAGLSRYRIDADTQGVIEKVSNIYNTSIVSNDANVFKAEYEAGFIQGRLQKQQIIPARDNSWDSAYLVDPTHAYPRQIPPTADEIAQAQQVLQANWEYTLRYMRTTQDPTVAKNLRRLMYRLVGIYHGATLKRPQALPFNGRWQPRFGAKNLALGYETPTLTFMDFYFVNAYADVLYLLPEQAAPTAAGSAAPGASPAARAAGSAIAGSGASAGAAQAVAVRGAIADGRPSKCSAFVLKTADGLFLTHNNWNSFLDQSQALSLWVAGDFISTNLGAPGYLCSDVDFGYTNKGLMFNETTHRYSYTEPKTDALWMFWRAALAEQFATTIDEFFQYMSLEASGTYMNGYMVANANTGRIGYIEMSYDAFVFYKLPKDGQGDVLVTTKPKGLSTAYDTELVTPAYVLGINYPASLLVRGELQSTDNRPMRRVQFMERIGGVHDVASAKALITYIDPANPLSIYGRWDLGFGVTPYPKIVPDGSCDAKAISARMVRSAARIEGVLDTGARTKSFWMKYGSPSVNGKPFIWSESRWAGQKLRGVPDVVAGDWRLLNRYIR